MATCMSSSLAVAQSSAEFPATRMDSSSHCPTFSPLPKFLNVSRRLRTAGFKVSGDCSARRARYIVVRATAGEGVASSPATTSADSGFQTLESAFATKNAEAVKDELDRLLEQGKTMLWSSTAPPFATQQVHERADKVGDQERGRAGHPQRKQRRNRVPGVRGGRDERRRRRRRPAPGDWGTFVPYLEARGVAVAVGSVAPGLFQVVIDKFSSTQGDYQEQILRHEAALFLTAYMVGIPIVDYSLDLGKEHVNLVDASVEKKIYEGLDANLLDGLAVVSMAGLAAEGLKYDKAMGQSVDLFSSQRLFHVERLASVAEER